jgi:hypothetical protein
MFTTYFRLPFPNQIDLPNWSVNDSIVDSVDSLGVDPAGLNDVL